MIKYRAFMLSYRALRRDYTPVVTCSPIVPFQFYLVDSYYVVHVGFVMKFRNSFNSI